MPRRRTWERLTDLSEEELRLQVILPLLAATPGLDRINDVHGRNEKGLDVLFYERGAIEDICYGLQLKVGTIGGGGTTSGTVREIIDQLGLASELHHPVAIEGAGKVQVDRYVVATSGRITQTAKDEIASRVGKIPVSYWDQTAIERRIRQYLPELFSAADGAIVVYLKAAVLRMDQLDALDQIPGVAKRTLTHVYEEPILRRRFEVPFEEKAGDMAPALPDSAKRLRDDTVRLRVTRSDRINALRLPRDVDSVVIGDQDAGKTALLRMLILQSARHTLEGSGLEPEPVPLLIRCKDLLRHDFEIEKLMAAELRNLQGDQLAQSLTKDLEAGEYRLLIDGFSELNSHQHKDRAAQVIDDFRKRYPKIHLVVAGRPADFLTPHYFQDFRHYVIEEFTQKQVSSLLNKWTSDSPTLADVAKKVVKRIREALQLPGSPISATIGVMLYEEDRRYITNTAEAVEKYMVIRLGRYAHELGIRQEVEWTRKQDLLAEIALEMIDLDLEVVPVDRFVERIDELFVKLGEKPRGMTVLVELLESGVLIEDDRGVSFHRTAFRDFFAGHAIDQMSGRDDFIANHFTQKKWGLALAFAAGLRRKNTDLLSRLVKQVRLLREKAIGAPSSDYFYCAYLLGRILSNSETTDEAGRLEVLREVLHALQLSLPEFIHAAKEQFGNIGELAALIGTEHTFLATVGVPWLENQFGLLAHDTDLTDEQRYFAASTPIHLGCPETLPLVETLIGSADDTRILLVLKVLLEQVMRERNLSDGERSKYKNLIKRLNSRLARPGRKREAKELTRIRSKALKLQAQRMARLNKS